MHETSPSVHLLARPSIDLEGMRAYLEQVGGASWLDRRLAEGEEAVNPGELLVEFAGRACYRSWEPGLNPNVTRVRTDRREYFANILRSAHGSVLEHASYSFALRDVSRVACYDGETQVLTRDGWMGWPDVDGSEEFATLDPVTEQLEYQRATRHFTGPYVGSMYRVASEQVDLLVTPNHRMWVRLHDTQAAKRGEERYGVVPAADLLGRRVHYLKAARWKGSSPATISIAANSRTLLRPDRSGSVQRTYHGAVYPARPFARFLGYWLSEGGIDRHVIELSQNPGPVHARMCATIRELGLSPHSRPSRPHSIRFSSLPLGDFLAGLGGVSHQRFVPPVVHSWSSELIREFLDAYVEGDGTVHATSGHTVAYTASRRMADDLQILAIKAGYSANVHVDNRVGLQRVMASGQVFHNVHPSYVVSFVRRRARPLVNHHRQGKAKHDCLVPFAGQVYCVEVPNGLLFVRRNGKVVVSGNTHEIVRHRAGAAYSQESLRYVRLVDIGFRIPPALEPLRRQCIEIVERLEEFQVEAARALEIDARGIPFHVKKEVTSALRRLAPCGLSTDLVMTMNLRTLRHVIEMRTAPGAEEEMRLVFGMLAELMVAEAPGLFQDFRRLDDGSWVPEHRKV